MIATLHALRYSVVCKVEVASEATETREAMTEEQEIRATHEEVEEFVGKLKEFHSSLDEGEQAMMDTILECVKCGHNGG